MNDKREIDIVVFGATGFVGKLVTEYFQNRYRDSDFTWALAGRSLEKLEQLKEEAGLSPQVQLLVANSQDAVSLTELTKRTRTVISTVGPYTLYGDALVRACVEQGTNYLDLCGEANFIRSMLDQYSERARESNARLLFSAGFDSLPSDLGVQYLQEQAIAKYGKPFNEVLGRVRAFEGAFSGGTAESFKVPMGLAMENPQILDHLVNPFSLTPGFFGPEQPDDQSPNFDNVINSWTGTFYMGSINRQNVHRTNFLTDFSYGKDFIYSEMTATGPGPEGQARAKGLAEDTWIMSEDAPKPGEGPNRETRENGYYEIDYIGQFSPNERLKVTVKGDMDPGYGSTAKIISETAICLLQNESTTKAGIWTGASALGKTLRDRLIKNAGLQFLLKN